MKSSVGSDSSSILLVDDNKLGLRARKAVLEEMGHRITTASEGEEALGHFDRTHFDLVITDFKMPKMDGLELIRAIRARGGHQTPIILISGYAEPLGFTQENTGADDVIAKTVNELTLLVRSVEKHLRRKKKPPGRSRPPSAKDHRTG